MPHARMPATLTTSLIGLIDKIISEDVFYQMIEDFLDEHTYLAYINPFIFLAFNKSYGDAKAAKAGLHKKQYIGKHQ